MKWICKECHSPCRLALEDNTTPTSCIICREDVNWRQEDNVDQPAAPPVLMTAPEATIAALKMGGGEVWHEQENTFRFAVNQHGEIVRNTEYSVSCNLKLYTVRPLPPADMSFDEAWECLKRGESVKTTDENNEHVHLSPAVIAYGGYNRGYTIEQLKDKRFRKAVENNNA